MLPIIEKLNRYIPLDPYVQLGGGWLEGELDSLTLGPVATLDLPRWSINEVLFEKTPMGLLGVGFTSSLLPKRFKSIVYVNTSLVYIKPRKVSAFLVGRVSFLWDISSMFNSKH